MLASVGNPHHWQWSAAGKHPAVKDYFRIGSNPLLSEAFADWVENGYQMLNPKEKHRSSFYSWRFWAKGPGKQSLVCGVGRDSSDSLGRPYPLLVMGTGLLQGWEDHWDLLPFAFERTWSQMEYLSTKRFTDFRQIEDEVRSIKPPSPNWSEFTDQRQFEGSDSNGGRSGDLRSMENRVSDLGEKTEFSIPLDSEPSGDPFVLAGLWHFLLKTRFREVPNAVFMGGVPEEACLAVFRRPLIPSDFVRLWTMFPVEP